MDDKIIEITGLKKEYGSKFKLAIDSLYLERNKVLTLIGPNGSGKSTLIKMICLLERPDEGNIFFNGKNISKDKINKVKIRKEMAVIFQEPALFNASVYNNLILGLKIRKINVFSVKENLDYLIKKLKIGHLLDRNVKNLSGGEKQRVSIARSLVLNSDLLLLDEPLSNIDQQSREDLREDLFEVIKNSGRSIIYVTHDRDEAMMIADDIAVLNDGRLEQFDSKIKIFTKPFNEFVAKFVGIETLIEGIVDKNNRKVCTVRIGGNGNRAFTTGEAKPGSKVVLAIRPEAVILYNNNVIAQQTSAMNIFKGRITEIRNSGVLKKVGVDCGFNLISFVTPDSVKRLRLGVGKEIFAGVKASSIHMFKK
ncbi:MAG: ABC transporter ATP-binding protein [Actinobacteria bacterium]|nr:ABC transporter ATP-binding protein [Actinomycetota bacterium]